jgi:hypothetical protein
MSSPVYYLAIGHVAKDLTPDGSRLGGSVAFAALTARALGYPAGVVTASADDVDLSPLAAVSVRRQPAAHSTTFENLYGPDGRTQYLRGRATPLSPPDVPTEWLRAPIVHLAPLAGELVAELFTAFENALVGLTVQGCLRGWDETGRVHRRDWPEAERFLPRAQAAVLSIEDVRGDWELLERWARITPLLVVTQGAQGCTVFAQGASPRQFPAVPQTEVDPTGAGDIFAAAYFIHLYETGDPWAAARLANALASISVTRVGLAGTPTLEEVGWARLKAEVA